MTKPDFPLFFPCEQRFDSPVSETFIDKIAKKCYNECMIKYSLIMDK